MEIMTRIKILKKNNATVTTRLILTVEFVICIGTLHGVLRNLGTKPVLENN